MSGSSTKPFFHEQSDARIHDASIIQDSAAIKGHAQNGYETLKDTEFPWPIAQIVWQHHERLDGSGYPQGLKGEEILLEARILAESAGIFTLKSMGKAHLRPSKNAMPASRAAITIGYRKQSA